MNNESSDACNCKLMWSQKIEIAPSYDWQKVTQKKLKTVKNIVISKTKSHQYSKTYTNWL